MFRTEIIIAQAANQLSRAARVLTLGSCFADSIGSRLVANKVQTLVNPFGTVFQPLAAGKLLRAAMGEEVDWQQHLVEARGRWQSYDLHGSIGAASPVDLLLEIQELARRTGEFLRNADVVVLTLGTAWAYRLRETGELVSNCHKMPAELFDKELLTPDEIINALAETHAFLKRINSKLRIVLTVSPVRHVKDTLPLNAVSKSVLRVACHYLSDLLKDVDYFPAFELMMDDLRDYRFYAADMLHPSEVAEDFIWDKFARAYFDADFGRFRKEWASVRQALHHRPLYAEAPEHRSFLEVTQERLERLQAQQVDVTAELEEVRERLAALPLPKQSEPVVILDDDEERIDIGEGAVVVTAAPETAELALPLATDSSNENRTARLSPEEFRAQRAARGGRGRRDGRREEKVQENPTTVAADAEATIIEATAEGAALPGLLEETPTTDVSVSASADLLSEETKKKKRRSRGGAKRTARKNAARLAAELEVGGEGEPTTGEETVAASDVATSVEPVAPEVTPPAPRNNRPEGKKSSVITKSVPVKRGGRLYAVPPAAAPVAGGLAGVIASLVPAAPVAEATPAASSVDVTATDVASPTNLSSELTPAIATEQIVEPIASAAVSAPESQPDPASEVLSSESESADIEPSVAPMVPARKPSRSRARANAASGARTEKPAIDIPIIPVRTDLPPRTQVAAGRLLGSSASLVKPTPTVNKVAVTPVELVAPVETPVLVEAPAEAPVPVEAPAPTPVKPKAAKNTPKKAVATPVVVAPVVVAPAAEVIEPTIAPLEPIAPITKAKAAPKAPAAKPAKASAKAPAKAAVAKVEEPAPAKPAKTKAAAKPAAPKPSKPKAVTAKPTAAKPTKSKTADKPKAPKKPTKPA